MINVFIDTSIFDEEDDIITPVEGRLRIPVLIAYAYGNDTMSIESINNEESLSRVELEASMFIEEDYDELRDEYQSYLRGQI